MSQKARVEDLERKTGGKADPFVVDFGRGDGLVVVSGETMTRDEFKARWPDVAVFKVVYES